MTRHFALGNKLPNFLANPLFGDRKTFGLIRIESDPCWLEYHQKIMDFYIENQNRGIGRVINKAGYSIMNRVNWTGKSVLEIGPGDMNHLEVWKDKARQLKDYVVADIKPYMLERSLIFSRKLGIPSIEKHLSSRTPDAWDFEPNSFDAVISFYSLEHLYPLEKYLEKIMSILKPGGILIGAIPCEGGLAWGAGRYLTSRRWFKKNTNINPDKIICWEHPNTAAEVLNILEKDLKSRHLSYWPMLLPIIDINLVARFIYEKR